LSRPIHWVDQDHQFAAIPMEDPRNPNNTREFFDRFLEASKLNFREGSTWQQAGEVLPSDANSGRPPKEIEP
jgi:hypothetical protein